MKTISITQNKFPKYIILSLISVLVVSCGTYQNTSYYDRDGIYGDTEPQNSVATTPQNTSENNQYKNYFGSLQDSETKKDSTFTNVESYKSDSYSNQESNSNGGWGSDSGTTVVNIYDNGWGWNNWGWNNYWNWNIGWGWNSWYGPNWGWGWNNWYGPNWGWGWNSWYGNPWCGGYYQPYYQGTRSFATVGNNNYSGGTRTFDGRRNNVSGVRTDNNTGIRTRNNVTIGNPRSNSNATGIRNTSNLNTSNSTPRFSNSTTRNQTNTTRNYNQSSTRTNSSSYGGNSGGGRYSGGSYGGGRSSGGSYGGGRSSGGRR